VTTGCGTPVQTVPPALVFESGAVKAFVQYVNWLGVPLLIIIVGVIRWARRKQTTRRVYVPLAGSEVQ
jgi:hypothetical protein